MRSASACGTGVKQFLATRQGRSRQLGRRSPATCRYLSGRFQRPATVREAVGCPVRPGEEWGDPRRTASSTWPRRPGWSARSSRLPGEGRAGPGPRHARASSWRSPSATTWPRHGRSTALLASVFDESQIYRIDHYLGKETVQNILAFRFANALFEPIWDRRYIDHVQITVAEAGGGRAPRRLLRAGRRAARHDPEPPAADPLPDRHGAAGLLRRRRDPQQEGGRAARHPPHPARHVSSEFAVRGQYGAGWMQGKHVPAYRAEPGVAPDSPTETFAALKLFVDNWRWQDVPFYLRTGKRLPRQVSEIAIQFRAGAAPIVSPARPRRTGTQPSDHADPARGGDRAALPGQAAGPDHAPEPGGHALLLPGGLQGAARPRPTRPCCWT